jgi:hypothetical protein
LLSAGQLAVSEQAPVPLFTVTVLLAIEQAPFAVIVGAVLALVVAETVKVVL